MDLIAAVAFCLMLGPAEAEACQAAVVPPPIASVCWSVTNYWPFDEGGTLSAWNGQADGDPHHTATMSPVHAGLAGAFAAGPIPLLGSVFVFPDGSRLPVLDTFGALAYQRGVFYHDRWGHWVIGVDVFTPEPTYYLECDGRIE